MLDLKKTLAKLLNCDYVVEEGTEGIWTYRKWASGIAECWGQVSNSSWMGSIALPLTFQTDGFCANATYMAPGNGAREVISVTRSEQTLYYYAVANHTVYLTVKGFWKAFTPVGNNTQT